MKKMDINSLRSILAEEIEKLRSGNTTPANVNAITNATGKILSTVKIEMEYHKLIGKTPNIDFILLDEKKEEKITNDELGIEMVEASPQ